jgi:hypothetical protein
MKRAALLLAGLLAVSSPQAQELGRLFFTPEERAALDARRRARLPDKPTAAPAAASTVTRVDGFVRRSDGPSTVWVNGATSDEASPGIDSRVSIPIGERARVRLRPGETLDRGTGEVRDVLGPNGEVRVRPGR